MGLAGKAGKQEQTARTGDFFLVSAHPGKTLLSRESEKEKERELAYLRNRKRFTELVASQCGAKISRASV